MRQPNDERTESQRIEIGEKLVEILMLKKDSRNKERYLTTWGNKTPLGIYHSVKRILEGRS